MKCVVSVIGQDICVGCGVCVNACPVDALVMRENVEGFICPEVDEKKCVKCGMCLSVCPKQNYEKNAEPIPEVHAAYATEAIQQVSSSGGLFTVLANHVLDMGGVVCGAAYNRFMEVNHIIIDNKKDLGRLRGSKYVQSNPGMIYADVKKMLSQGKIVLFSGTPCQVAAMKNFAGKDANGLFTVDILCHGVPPYRVFQRYLDEIRGTKSVHNVEFRSKKFGWSAEHIIITFNDGTKYEGAFSQDPYVKGFLRNVFLRKSCEHCDFSEVPRCADITLGDFWGIRKIDEKLFSSLGTSIVFLNNSKGKELYGTVAGQLALDYKLPFTPDKYPNRIHEYYRHNSKRNYFFERIDSRGLNDIINNDIFSKRYVSASRRNSVIKKHDIGLVCNFCAGNFGGSLTQYALYNILKKMDKSVLMIDHHEACEAKTNLNTLKKIYIEMPYPMEDVAPMYPDKFSMRTLNDVCDDFVVGSDQLFQFALFQALGEIATLDWVDDAKRKIAVAASFGHAHVWGSRKKMGEMAHFMKRFDAFSVREESAVNICKENYGVNARWILDPVFLCDRQVYEGLAKKAKEKLPENFIGSYMLDPSNEKKEMIVYLENKFNTNCLLFSEFSASAKYMEPLNGISWSNYRVEERLNILMNSKFVITDSFHGTCLAIIFRVPFVSILNKKRGADRFYSLLRHFHLEDRLIENVEDLKNIPNLVEVDFDKVYEILAEDRADSLNWIQNALEKPKSYERNDYSILSDLLAAQQREIRELKALVSNLSKSVGILNNITNIHEYMDALIKRKAQYIIYISVKDTPGLALTNDIAQKINELGFKVNLEGCHWCSYIGVQSKGELVHEELSSKNEAVEKFLKLENMDIHMESRCWNAGNIARIIVNGTDYAVNRRGLNFVVWDVLDNKLADTVCFDTHTHEATCYRN